MASRTYYVGSGPGIKVLQNADSGGSSWNMLPYSTSFSNNPYVFDVQTDPLDANKVFIVGVYTGPVGNFKGIAVSTNGGATWTTPVGNWDTAVIVAAAAIPANTYNINKVWVTDSNNIYVCGDGGLIFKSVDGGISFNTIPSLPSTISTANVTSLHFPTNGQGVVGVTDSTGNGYVVQTSNDGVFWYILNNGLTLTDPASVNIGRVESVYINQTDQLVVACGTKRIFKSTASPYTSFTNVFSWPNQNGRHMTWYQSGGTRKFWAVGIGDHIVSTTNDWTTPVTVRPYLTPPISCAARSNRLNYNGAHFFGINSGFYAVSSCLYGVTYSTTPSTYTVPGNAEVAYTAVNAVWTTIIPFQCYTLTNCVTGQSYVTTVNLGSYVGQIVTFNTVVNNVVTRYSGCYVVGSLPPNPNPDQACPGALQNVVISGTYPNCTYCTTNCFNLVNCDPEQADDIIVVPITFSSYYQTILDKYVTISGCGDKCYKVVLSTSCTIDPNAPAIDYQNLVTAVYDTCQECSGIVVPEPFTLHMRRVKPGFYTPGCPPEYTVKTSCTFAEQVYDEMVAIRYGITICCDHDINKWDIKKQLLELNAIYDPSLCTSSVVDCLPPCNVDASVSVSEPLSPQCPEPDDVTGVVVITDPCPVPDPPVATAIIEFGAAPNADCYISLFTATKAIVQMTSITVDGNVINLTGTVTASMTTPLFQTQFIAAMGANGYLVSGISVIGSTNLGYNLYIQYFAGGVPQSFVHNGNNSPTSVFISNTPCNA